MGGGGLGGVTCVLEGLGWHGCGHWGLDVCGRKCWKEFLINCYNSFSHYSRNLKPTNPIQIKNKFLLN